MGLLRRIKSVARGFMGLFVSGIEEKNPDAILEDIKIQIEKAKKEAAKNIIQLQTNAEILKIENTELLHKIYEINEKIMYAQKMKNEEALTLLLIERDHANETLEQNKITYDQAVSEVYMLKNEYKNFERNMNNKLEDLKKIQNQAKLAELKSNILTLKEGFHGIDNTSEKVKESMEKAKKIINAKTARLNAINTLSYESNTECMPINMGSVPIGTPLGENFQEDMRVFEARNRARKLISD